ncbi:MAG: putative rRNA maturation factor [Sulfitobacter sp.]|jgi:probable rRNA maturation factor
MIDVILESGDWHEKALTGWAEQASDATLQHLGLNPWTCEIALLACDDARIAELNGDFRNKPAATNVLSWPSEERAASAAGGTPAAPQDEELGDIALAYETCAAEATAQSKTFEAHITHLLVHGTLHLLGYDHINDQDAALMEALEVEILGKLGIADPYERQTA